MLAGFPLGFPNAMETPTLIALLHGPDQPGLVARVSGWIFARGGNILHADQHRDREAGIFFQRIEWVPTGAAGVAEREAADFLAFAASLGMQAKVILSSRRARIAVFVSKADHCFHDLILRWKAGDFSGDIVAIVGNHTDLAEAARGYGVPFHAIPVTADTKPQAEARQLALLDDLGADLVVLARYMQVLSADLLEKIGRPVINIHHSFLPAFAGGKPYHQAHARGVKIIGATAHYVTDDLDEGPIIEQSVERVTHAHSPAALEAIGRGIESAVLSRAVTWHLEHRVVLNDNKTVVFN